MASTAAKLTSTDATRGQAANSHMGLQVHPGSRVAFRNIERKAI